MKRRTFLRLSVLAPLALAAESAVAAHPRAVGDAGLAAEPDGRAHRFALAPRQFMLDGRAFQIRSGQMDLVRIPRNDWRRRIRIAKAMGLNTISSYLMWNAMEEAPGRFDLETGRRDFARFIDVCAEEGMWVYLRPGPYVCGEWDFGGLPAWLLRDPQMRVRHLGDRHYMDAVARYFDAVAPRVRARMAANGGPILMLQIENEYASFGSDLGYLERLRSMWQARGIGGPFSISDGLTQLQHARTYLPGTALGLDGDVDFAGGERIAQDAPVWVGEGYTGWLSHWGDRHAQVSDYGKVLRQLMEAKRSFNLYEVNGGTSFGFGAGANAADDGSHFEPDITSYDYGAPIDERGVVTAEYHRLRGILSAALGGHRIEVPQPTPVATFGPVLAQPWASLWDHLPPPRAVGQPAANELLTGQVHGMVLYRKRLALHGAAMLRIVGVHDYATVLADGRLVGTVSRCHRANGPSQDAFQLVPGPAGAVQLDILVDSFGHVNYGRYIRDYKGLLGPVQLDGNPVGDWDVYALPLDASDLDRLTPTANVGARPGIFFRTQLALVDTGDTYLDMSRWNKGYVWVNRHLLGRYWCIGPQQRLYCPAEYWRRGRNEVLVLDQHLTRATAIVGRATVRD